MYNYLADYQEVDKRMCILKINLLLLSILPDMLLLNLRLSNIELFRGNGISGLLFLTFENVLNYSPSQQFKCN